MSILTEPKPGSPPRGIDFVYETVLKKIEQQQKLVDSLDVKMGILVAFLGTFIVGLLVAALTSEVSKVAPQLWLATKVIVLAGITLAGACLYFAFDAFKEGRQFFSGVRPRDLVSWVSEEVETTKKAFLPTILWAVDANDHQLSLKGDSARRAIIWVFFALGVLWVSLLLLGVQFTLGRVMS